MQKFQIYYYSVTCYQKIVGEKTKSAWCGLDTSLKSKICPDCFIGIKEKKEKENNEYESK